MSLVDLLVRMNHECSAYCRDGAHADLAYSTEAKGRSLEFAIKMILDDHCCDLMEFRRAHEAPPKEGHPYAFLTVFRSRCQPVEQGERPRS